MRKDVFFYFIYICDRVSNIWSQSLSVSIGVKSSKRIRLHDCFSSFFGLRMAWKDFQIAIVTIVTRGGFRPKLKGGNLERGCQEHNEKLARRRRAKIFGTLFEKFLWFFY